MCVCVCVCVCVCIGALPVLVLIFNNHDIRIPHKDKLMLTIILYLAAYQHDISPYQLYSSCTVYMSLIMVAI